MVILFDGIAISCPGRVVCHEGIVYGSPLSDFKEFAIVSYLKDRFGLSASVNNDGKCAALAEK